MNAHCFDVVMMIAMTVVMVMVVVATMKQGWRRGRAYHYRRWRRAYHYRRRWGRASDHYPREGNVAHFSISSNNDFQDDRISNASTIRDMKPAHIPSALPHEILFGYAVCAIKGCFIIATQ
jgi:hypothetical protein